MSGRTGGGGGGGSRSGAGYSPQRKAGVALPSKLLLSKREPGRHVFAGRGLTVASGRRRRGGEKEEPHKPRNFVDSLPIAMCTLEVATRAIKVECDAQLGRGRHIMNGAQWASPDPDKPKPSHVEFLARKQPWVLLAADGAGSILDEEHYAQNPRVELGVSGRGNNQIHALANVFVEAISEWAQAGTRVYMGKRGKEDATPESSHAPPAFPTQHAMLMRAKPYEWDVPPAYEKRVCRVIARLEDAEAPTRFWVVCPVRSSALKPWTAEWAHFVSQLCASAAKAKVLDDFSACLIPIVPGYSRRTPMYGIEGLEHPCSSLAGHPDDAVPPAHIMDAFLSGYLQMDERGVEPADEDRWDDTSVESDGSVQEGDEDEPDSDSDSDADSDADADADTDTEPDVGARGHEDGALNKGQSEGKGDKGDKGDKQEKRKPMALAFTPDDDLLIAVCDTRLAFPLVTMVLCNDELRNFEFHGHHEDEDEGGDERGGRGDGDNFIVDWGQLRDTREWVGWSPRM